MNQSRRVSVNVPEEWIDEADEMDIAKTEYLRRMVRAGRRQWGHDHIEEPEKKGIKRNRGTSSGMGDVLQSVILNNLSTDAGINEDELVEVLFDELLEDVGEHLQDLKDAGKADYNPRDGGWVKTPGDSE